MNIKSLTNSILNLDVKRISKETKTQASSDRDANGKREDTQEKTPRRNLSEEEIQAAIQFLRDLKGVKDNNLTIRLVRQNNVPVVFVEDRSGKIVRRIPESELSLIDTTGKEKGNLLDKSL